MKRLPIIVERTRNSIRGVAFKASVMGSSFEESRIHEFESADFETQNEELNLFLRENFFDNTGIYINLPPEELILRELTLPFISKSKIKELLPFELESQLPYDVSEIFYDYHIYPNLEKNEAKIVVCACRKDFLLNYAQFFLQNKMPLKGIYVHIDGILHLSSLVKESFGCVLYMSGSFSTLLITRDGIWQYSRILPIGYDSLFNEISGKWKKNIPDSRKLLTEIPVSDSDIVDYEYYQQKFKLTKAKAKELVDILLNFSGAINHEVKSTFLKVFQEENPPDSILLMSDLENQVFLENILSEKLSSHITPFSYGSTPISLIGRPFVIPIGLSYAIASNRNLDLMGAELKKLFKKKKDNSDKVIYASLFLALILFAGSFFINILQKRNQYKQIEDKKNQLFSSLFGKAPLEETSLLVQASQLVNEQKKRSEVFKLQANKYKLSQILFEMNQALLKARDIKIERFNYSNNTVNIIGTTTDFNELNNIKSQILANPIFDDANFKDQRSYPGPEGQNRVRFNLVIKPKVQED